MKTAVILARVSTMAQDFDRQVDELKSYALNNDLNIMKIFHSKECISDWIIYFLLFIFTEYLYPLFEFL